MEQGCHKISFEEYLADPCPEASLSRGCIPLLLDAPIKAWWNHPRLNPQPKEESEAKFDQGKACHNLLLEGGQSIVIITGFDDWRKKEAQEARKAARENGLTPLLQKQADTIFAMADAALIQIRSCEELQITNLVAQGDAEMTYIWQEMNGIWCRVRPDWISNERTLILDYKTTGTSVNPDEFSNHISKMDYPIQSVFYRRGVFMVEGVKPEFVFIAQEDEPPYLCSFHGIDFQSEEMAQEKVAWAIKKWRSCLDSGVWEGYPKRVCYAEPKPWTLAEWESKKYRMEE